MTGSTWKDFLSRGAGGDINPVDALSRYVEQLDPDEPAMIVYTSGTTGKPKGAMLSGRNALGIADDLTARLDVGPNDTLLSYLPLCHVAEKIFTYFIPLTAGAVVHFGESIETVRQDLVESRPRFFGRARIWEKMRASVTLKMKDSSWLKRSLFRWALSVGSRVAVARGTGDERWTSALLLWVADLLILRALQERLGLRKCRLPYSGAAPISADLLAWFHGVGIPIYEGFGQTESAGLITMNWPGNFRLGSVGKAIPNTDLMLAGDGEILASGAHIFKGYLHNPDATAKTIDSEGWLLRGTSDGLTMRAICTLPAERKRLLSRLAERISHLKKSRMRLR